MVRPREQAGVWGSACCQGSTACSIHPLLSPLTQKKVSRCQDSAHLHCGLQESEMVPFSELVSSDPDLTCERTMEEREDTVKPLLWGPVEGGA